MRIRVDRDKCLGVGNCEAVAPDVFELDDDGELVLKAETVPDGALDAVETAVAGCPTEALSIEP